MKQEREAEKPVNAFRGRMKSENAPSTSTTSGTKVLVCLDLWFSMLHCKIFGGTRLEFFFFQNLKSAQIDESKKKKAFDFNLNVSSK